MTVVRLEDGRVRLLGQRERPADRPPFDLDRLPAGRLVIEDAVVAYRDLKSGRAPIELHALDLELRRDRDDVVFEGTTSLPEELGESLEFSGRLNGSLDAPQDLDARLELQTEELRLTGLQRFLPAHIAVPLDGSGAVRAVGSLQKGQLRHARLDVDLRNVVLRLPARTVPGVETVRISPVRIEQSGNALPHPIVTKTVVERPAPALPAEVHYAVLQGDLKLRQENGGWTFIAEELHAQGSTDRARRATRIDARWRGKAVSTFALELALDDADLAALWPLALAFGPPLFDRWAGLSPVGRIRTLRLRADRQRAGAAPRFTVEADIAALGVQPHARFPGLSGLSATLEGNDQHGQAHVRSTTAKFDWPRLFRAPIEFDRATADVTWRRDGETWILQTYGAELGHRKGRAQADVEFRYLDGSESPVLAMTAAVDDIDVTVVPQVLPVGRLRERTIAWLDSAFRQGRGMHGHLVYRGPVRKFPFRNGEGEFLATVDAADVTLDYFPGFAPLTGASGKAEFHNASVSATVAAGQVSGLALERGSFHMEDYKRPVFEIAGGGAGDLGKALRMLQATPLGPRLGKQFMALSGAGPARYDLKLVLPVASEATPGVVPDGAPARAPGRRVLDYQVSADLDAVNVSWPVLRAPAQKVTGEFEIHNDAVHLRSVRGTILDGPFELSAVPGRVSTDVISAVEFTAHGRAAGARLPAFIGLPRTIRMAGTADWQLQGRLEQRQGKRWPVQLDVTSTLAGLEIGAPQPFAKAAAETRPTRVRLDIPGNRYDDVSIESGSARARLRFAEQGDKWRLERGMARFDGQSVALPAHPGLFVAGDWPQFDLAEWLALSDPDARGERLMDWLGPVDVHLASANVLGYRLSEVTAHLRGDRNVWRIDVDGPQARGAITVPDNIADGRPIVLDLERLHLLSEPSAVTGDSRASRTGPDPRTLPAVTAQVDDFTWQSRRFGRLQAVIAREPRGLVFETLATSAPDFTIQGHGGWQMEGGVPRTRLELELKSTNFGAAARALGYRDAVEASNARFAANVSWPGGPSEDAFKRMNGTLQLALDDGQLRDLEPGAGRMLGLLSVAQLPRRLALDFRDVTDQGLAFDTVRGDFELRAGNAFTQNLLLKGPAVDIGVVGRTGLGTEDYDQTVVVSGNPGGPLVVAGALAAGPVVGAGVLVLSQLFKGQLQGLTRAYYHVTGPWSAPVVQRISAPATENAAAAGRSDAPAAGVTP